MYDEYNDAHELGTSWVAIVKELAKKLLRVLGITISRLWDCLKKLEKEVEYDTKCREELDVLVADGKGYDKVPDVLARYKSKLGLELLERIYYDYEEVR